MFFLNIMIKYKSAENTEEFIFSIDDLFNNETFNYDNENNLKNQNINNLKQITNSKEINLNKQEIDLTDSESKIKTLKKAENNNQIEYNLSLFEKTEDILNFIRENSEFRKEFKKNNQKGKFSYPNLLYKNIESQLTMADLNNLIKQENLEEKDFFTTSKKELQNFLEQSPNAFEKNKRYNILDIFKFLIILQLDVFHPVKYRHEQKEINSSCLKEIKDEIKDIEFYKLAKKELPKFANNNYEDFFILQFQKYLNYKNILLKKEQDVSITFVIKKNDKPYELKEIQKSLLKIFSKMNLEEKTDALNLISKHKYVDDQTLKNMKKMYSHYDGIISFEIALIFVGVSTFLFYNLYKNFCKTKSKSIFTSKIENE